MKTSILQKQQFLKDALLQLVDISGLVQDKDHFFLEKFEDWLTAVEAQLKGLHLAEASYFSVYRTLLFNTKLEKGKNKRRMILSKAIGTIQQAQQTLYNLYYPIDQKIQQAEEIIENLLVIANEDQAFREIEKDDFSRYINKVWLYLLKQEPLQAHVNQLKLLVSTTDIMLLLGQKVNL